MSITSDLRYPPVSRPASDFGPAALEAAAAARRAARASRLPRLPPDLPDGPVDLLCPRPLHHVLEYAALYGIAAKLREEPVGGNGLTAGGAGERGASGGRRRVRLFVRSALFDWSPFGRLPADEVVRLPEAAEASACRELLARLREDGATCLLLGGDPAWEELAAGLPRLRRLALGPDFQWRLPAGRDCAAASDGFFAALARQSPLWLSAPDAPPPLLAPGGRGRGRTPASLLVYQGRSHLGDALWLTPLLRAACRLLPGARLTVVCSPEAARILAANRHCAELLVDRPDGGAVEGREERRGRGALLDGLRQRRFDAALFAFARRPQSRWLAVAAAELGIPRRVDLEYFESAGDGREIDPLFTHQGWFFWGTMASPRLLLHALDPLAEGGLGEPVAGAPGPDRARRPRSWLADRRLELRITADGRREAGVRLAAHGCAGEPFAVLAPAGRSSARWPPRKFAALARWIASELGLHVLIEGGAADRALLDELQAELARPGCPAEIAASLATIAEPPGPECGNRRGRIGVYHDPLGVLVALLERASLLVANDSAPIHLAETTGTPTLYFAHHEKLTHSHPLGAACWALFDGGRNRPARISVDRVMTALREMMQRGLLRAPVQG
ncbi:MAG TPA: hypothetical protein VHR45_15730 [Thermoanaerobaculia bacterium]|nr:hypothetical protein [Thermoanaerobaculia bacterium]